MTQEFWTFLQPVFASNTYTLSNQPLVGSFYRLSGPPQTMVVAWGDNTYNQMDIPSALTNVISLAAGLDHSLSVQSGGGVVAWGYATAIIDVPTNLPLAQAVAAGWNHSLTLLHDGTLRTWGYNQFHEKDIPAGLSNVTAISANAIHSIALKSDGTVVSWGYSGNGETNVPSGLSNVVAIAAGGKHSLAAKSDGTVVAWGANDYGQTNVPTGLSNVIAVAAGWIHSLALKRDGTVTAWGANYYGQSTVPSEATNVIAIAAGGGYAAADYSLALRSDGTVVPFGAGPVMELPTGMDGVIAIAAGNQHAVAVRYGRVGPVIIHAPTTQYQIAGLSATFSVMAEALAALQYQWMAGGTNISGATNSSLTFTNVGSAQEGSYSVTISSTNGSITSSNASFVLVTPPVITSKTTNQVAIFKENLTLGVTATAPGQEKFPLHYQWSFNGTNAIGTNSNSYTLLGDTNIAGTYALVITNAAGSTNTSWSVSMTYSNSYIDVGTLAYHLSTNAVGRTNGYSIASGAVELSGWTWDIYYQTNLYHLTNSVWATNFWLRGVAGLSATAIGVSNAPGGQGLPTMVSPRHYLCAQHMHPEQNMAAFLGTNNVIYWRSTVQRVDLPWSFSFGINNDISIGILDSDLPASVQFLPVVPTNLWRYLPTNDVAIVQGIGMNQIMKLFSQPMTFADPVFVKWNNTNAVPFGLATNWNVQIVNGDSSAPAMLLISNQLVLSSHNYQQTPGGPDGFGPNYSFQIDAINQYMHYLSTNNPVGTNDYQLTTFPLTNWPTIH